MGDRETPAAYPATSDEMTNALNAALEAGDLDRIMGTMGEMTRAHRMKRVAQETGLGRESLYKSMRAGPVLTSTPCLECCKPWASTCRSHLYSKTQIGNADFRPPKLKPR